MKVLITGASGSLGRSLVGELQGAGWELLLLGRSLDRLRQAFPGAGFNLVQTDYGVSRLGPMLASVDAVVHLAARRYSRDFPSISDYDDNVTSTGNLARAAAEAGAQRFVFASTRMIYSHEVNSVPFREDEPVAPRNPYAISKLAAENAGAMAFPGFIALRFAQLVGLGEREEFFLTTAVRSAQAGKPITVFGSGSGARDYLYVRDAAQAIVRAIQSPGAAGVFNIGSGVATSHLELAGLVSKVFSGGRSGTALDPSRPEDASRTCLDIGRAARDLDWRPRYSLEQALEEMREQAAGGPGRAGA